MEVSNSVVCACGASALAVTASEQYLDSRSVYERHENVRVKQKAKHHWKCYTDDAHW